MSITEDQNLAPTGRRKINQVRDFIPVLGGIEARLEQGQPFISLRVAAPARPEAKTVDLGYVLVKDRAEVCLTGSSPLSTRDGMATGLVDMGVKTFGIHGTMREEYESLLIETFKFKLHLIVDNGDDSIHLLGDKCVSLGEHLIGGCEETIVGIPRPKARKREGILPCPMMAVNDAKAKHYYSNKYGTSQFIWDIIMHTASLVVADETVVVTGYGQRGKGVAMWVAGMGVSAIVTEVDPFKAPDATINGFRVMLMDEAARYGDIFVIIIGYKDIITPGHFAVMRHNVILTNAGHSDCKMDVAGLTTMAVKRELHRDDIEGFTLLGGRMLNIIDGGQLVNPAIDNDHPAEIMDMSFSAQALAPEWLVRHRDGLERKVYQVPAEADDVIGRVKLTVIGLPIGTLTPGREKYLNGWKV